MKHLIIFIYGIFAYLFGLSTLVWFLLFVGSWDFLPSHIDSMQTTSFESALTINITLVILFALQHSIMARQSFKKYITKFIPISAERSTYVLVSGVFLSLICIYWQGIDGYLWRVDNQVGQIILISIYIFGWTFSVVSSFLINHFELFGLEQVYLNLKNRVAPEITFKESSFYKFIRHPIQLGTLIGIWATPNMSYTHLMLSVTFTSYIFIGLYFEEKDLAKTIGKKYEAYQKQVPMIIPFIK
ncbi:NnrU family protein [Sulfurimonas sp.]|uniref:methyltransferase family protein n=1 Tax=Sulfurimonas sp. TaxID=2022749 RepID=UPI0025D74166|nr:NnrU family protein [Sulfurimonas sp.]MDD5156862.1 NnrU family protein [Sulfurimonas sp.]